ncbi:hypothetical protein B0H19DRAFT_1097559 [Mycena capillaripes]|nr:hypothetical protein B0H19DRAFT_1097559 [Mycena capillaripes]
MSFPFPSRARWKTWRTTAKHKLTSTAHNSSSLPDVLWTSLVALQESADAFPPLKSAVGTVIALCKIAERARNCKSDAYAIALRTKDIMDVIADAVPDIFTISPPMRLSIEHFSILFQLTSCTMLRGEIASTGGLSRLLHLHRNELTLQRIKSQLEDTYRDFLGASVLRLEVQQTQLMMHQKTVAVSLLKHQLFMTNLYCVPSPAWTRQDIFSISFFGRPLMLPYKLHIYPHYDDTYPRGPASQGTYTAFPLFNQLCMERPWEPP